MQNGIRSSPTRPHSSQDATGAASTQGAPVNAGGQGWVCLPSGCPGCFSLSRRAHPNVCSAQGKNANRNPGITTLNINKFHNKARHSINVFVLPLQTSLQNSLEGEAQTELPWISLGGPHRHGASDPVPSVLSLRASESQVQMRRHAGNVLCP